MASWNSEPNYDGKCSTFLHDNQLAFELGMYVALVNFSHSNRKIYYTFHGKFGSSLFTPCGRQFFANASFARSAFRTFTANPLAANQRVEGVVFRWWNEILKRERSIHPSPKILGSSQSVAAVCVRNFQPAAAAAWGGPMGAH